MSTLTMRAVILRANALYVGLAGFAGVIFDLRGVYFGLGPQGRILTTAPHAAIGFVEAHGLAAILAIVLWRSTPTRAAHATALAMSALLGVSNILFWQMFIAADALAVGYVTTALHWTFVALQFFAMWNATNIVPARAADLR
jgi:hypothetical protein